MKTPRSNIPFESAPHPDGVSLFKPGNLLTYTHLGNSEYPPGTVRLSSEIISGIAPVLGKTISTVLPWELVKKIALRATKDHPALAAELAKLLTTPKP